MKKLGRRKGSRILVVKLLSGPLTIDVEYSIPHHQLLPPSRSSTNGGEVQLGDSFTNTGRRSYFYGDVNRFPASRIISAWGEPLEMDDITCPYPVKAIMSLSNLIASSLLLVSDESVHHGSRKALRGDSAPC